MKPLSRWTLLAVLCVSGAAGASTPPSSPPGDATLAGRVTAPDGSPAPGTAVVGFCQGRERVVADGEGHYEIPNLKSGVCTVLARNEARGQRTLSVKIMPGENHLDIALEPLEKRWPLRGRVVDPEGRPVEGAEVENRPEGLTALTSADGSFVLETARTGLDLLARKLGYAPGVLVNRLAEAPTEGLEIRLRKEKIVSGRVTETDGRPVRNALVQGTQAVLWEHQPRLEPPRTMTDEEGRFILRGLPEPDGVAMYLLDVCPKGHELLRLGIRDLPEPAEIEAPVDGKIAGLVVGPDGKPFAGASVTAVQNMLTFAPSPCPSGPRTAITDAKGRFTFEHLGPGLYQFVAKVREYRSYLGAWQIDPGANDKGPTLHLVRELPEELTSPAQR